MEMKKLKVPLRVVYRNLPALAEEALMQEIGLTFEPYQPLLLGDMVGYGDSRLRYTRGVGIRVRNAIIGALTDAGWPDSFRVNDAEREEIRQAYKKLKPRPSWLSMRRAEEQRERERILELYPELRERATRENWSINALRVRRYQFAKL